MHHWKHHRRYLQRLWRIYAPFADQHFRHDAKKHFLERYWEMYLAVTLMANGSWPVRVGLHGPEFFFAVGATRVWVEATAPGAGTGPDQVRENDPDDNYRVPLERILLRYTATVLEKNRKLKKDILEGVVREDDPYVLAINGRGIPYAPWGNTLPYLLQALFPIGPLTLTFDVQTKEITGRIYEHRPSLSKRSRAKVSTRIFLDPAYAGISAVIHSTVDAANLPRRLGGDFYVVHNPIARNPLSIRLFAQWPQYVFGSDRITCIPATRRTSRRRMSPQLRAVLRAALL